MFLSLIFAIALQGTAYVSTPTVRSQVLEEAAGKHWDSAWATIHRFQMERDAELQQDPELFSAVAITMMRTGRQRSLHELISRQSGGLRSPVALLAGTKLAQEGLSAQSIALFEAIPEAERDEAVWFNLGLAQSRGRHFGTARRCYFRAIDSHPDYGEAYFHVGLDYATVGEAELAAAWLSRAFDLEPGRPDVALAFLEQLLLLGFTDTVSEKLKLLLAAAPEQPLLRTAEGELEMARGNLAAARKAFDLALVNHPDITVALIGRGRLAKREGDLKTATQCFERAENIDKQSPATLELARLAFTEGQNAVAIRHFTAACQGGCSGEAALEFARALLAVGRAREALELLDRQTKLKDEVIFHHLLSRAYQLLGRATEAVRERQAAEALRQQRAETLPFETPKAYVH